MSDSPSIQADIDALNELIVNCSEFRRLEELLGGFNLFEVLKFEYGEIRHSNVLAWILDPEGSHGLGASFIQKWLMRVIHESGGATLTPISPVDIDGWELTGVEVRREWRHIDLLLILQFVDREQWLICIENKVASKQHSNQLSRYRDVVEDNFPTAARRLYLFLTRDEEMPNDEVYLCASYAQVHRVLAECMQIRSHAIGQEPKVLLESYLRLLEEKFMDESEVARTAFRIYQQHRRALDIIFEHRPDNLQVVSQKVRALFQEQADRYGIVMTVCTKTYIRFVPKAWDQPGNKHGQAWAGSNRTILFELMLREGRPELRVVTGRAPEAWIEPIWSLAARAPFRRQGRGARPRVWYILHAVAGNRIDLVEVGGLQDSGALAEKVFSWAINTFQSDECQQIIGIIATHLPRLNDLENAASSGQA